MGRAISCPSNSYLSTNYWVDVVFEASPDGNVAPVVTNPGSQSGTVGTAVTALQIVATDGNGDALTFSATGLPAGLRISAAGLVTQRDGLAGGADDQRGPGDGHADDGGRELGDGDGE